MFAGIFISTFGAAAIAWGLVTVPIFRRDASMEYVARHIIRGEPYKIEALKRQLLAIEAAENSRTCRPDALRSAAIIRLRMLEQTQQSGAEKRIDSPAMKKLDDSIRLSLSCSAAEPFLWLVLYWVETAKNRSARDYSKFLRMSYQLGPNEGWIALKRNPQTFAGYERLPPDLKSSAITEFLALITSGFNEQAADIFSGAAWRERDAILPQLATLSDRKLEAFARIVYQRGIDVKIPGFESPNSKRSFRLFGDSPGN